MNLTIHTYGHIDAMFHILNGIAMIMDSTFADLMIKSMAMVSTCYFGFRAAYASSSGGSKQSLAKVGAMVLIINSLLIPKTTMHIEDHVTKQRDHVDNLPYGFAIPVGFMEQFGNVLTASFEQAFSTVPDGDMRTTSNYRDYGMVFGARLIQEARNWRIKTPEFVHNMDHFIRRCVVMDAAIGYKYTINDLFETDDIWGLITEAPSQLRRIEMKVGNTNELLTCKEAVDTVLKPAFASEIVRLAEKYAKTEFGLAGKTAEMFSPRGVIRPNNLFKTNLDTIFGGYLGSTKSAETNLKQYMMMNSLSDYARTYGYARASMTQDTNWQIAGDMASTYLPILLSVIKGLVYASFIFMVPLMLLGGGGAKYMSYIAVVASLQLWPALNAVLNMFIDLYSCAQMHDIAGGAVSFTSYSKLGSYSDKIVAVASGLQMMIPFLAFNIVQGGVGGFIHLAGNITGASSSAAASAAGEITTGNKSFDNHSRGNMQIAMNQGFKTDFNQSYKTGAREMRHEDGIIERVLPNGKSIFQSGIGITASGGSSRFTSSDRDAAQISNSLSSAQNILENEQRIYHEAERSTFSKSASWLAQVAERSHNDMSYDYSTLGEVGKSIQKAVSMVHTIKSEHGCSYETASRIALGMDGKIPLTNLVGGLTQKLFDRTGMPTIGNIGELNIGLDGSISGSKVSHNSFGGSEQFNREIVTRDDYNNIVRAGKNESFAFSRGIDKSYSDDIRGSHEVQKSAEKSIQIQFDKVDSLSRSLARIESKDASYDREMFEDVQNAAVSAYNVPPLVAHRMMEAHDPMVGKVWNRMSSANIDSATRSEMKAQQIKFSKNNIKDRLDDAEKENARKIDTDYTKDVKAHSVNQGVNSDDKNFVQNTIKEKVEDILIDNRMTHKNAKKEYEKLEQAKQEQIKQK